MVVAHESQEWMSVECSWYMNHKYGNQMSNHGMVAAHKLLKWQVWDDHGMFAAH